MSPDECEHLTGTGLGEHLSWCNRCLRVRYRDDTGEDDDQAAALDALDVRVVPDHIQRSPSDQWRLIAADLAQHATPEVLAAVREAHVERVGMAPDFDPATD